MIFLIVKKGSDFMISANLETYFANMDSSIDDKLKIRQSIKEGNILEIGFGGGKLLSELDKNPNNTVYGIDLAQESLDKAIKLGLKNVYLGDAVDMKDLVPKGLQFDTIIMCSIVHEIFSYHRNDYEQLGVKMANFTGLAKVSEVFSEAYKLLKPNGVLIIRDGVKVEQPLQKNSVRFQLDSNGFDILNEYQELFTNKFNYSRVGNVITTDRNSAMEFLYTYTWGKQSLAREKYETYGIMTLNEYKEFLTNRNFQVLEAYEYLQEGYIKPLEHVHFYDTDLKSNRLPNTNMLLISKKPEI